MNATATATAVAEPSFTASPTAATPPAHSDTLSSVVQLSEGRVRSTVLRLDELANEVKEWEVGAYANSNATLYSLIQKAYRLYADLTNVNDSTLADKKQGLKDYLVAKDLGKYIEKPLSQRIIYAVFGDRDRRRVSTYNVALRSLIADKVKADDVIEKITEAGGLHEMSVKRSTNALTVKQKAEQVVESVKSTVLCAIKNAETDKLFNAEKVGEQYVAVLTLEADGSLNLNAVVDNNAALTIALAAHYNAQKAAAKATAE